MPARVVAARADDARLVRALPKRLELIQRLGEVAFGSDDADQVLHRLLQVRVDVVRALAVHSLEGLERIADEPVELRRIHLRLTGNAERVLRSEGAGSFPEHEEVRKRVPAESVRTV